MPKSREVPVDQNEPARDFVYFSSDLPAGEKDNSASLETFHTTFDMIPMLMSQKMNKRFSRRLRYLLDKL
ncbi:MAG: hypothetical protein JRD68_03655 [Deltaproteobacteria bacterium]|nr:hypothetical protein [Deltaproteobacteria bacterium]